jgi:hypothetical protein
MLACMQAEGMAALQAMTAALQRDKEALQQQLHALQQQQAAASPLPVSASATGVAVGGDLASTSAASSAAAAAGHQLVPEAQPLLWGPANLRPIKTKRRADNYDVEAGGYPEGAPPDASDDRRGSVMSGEWRSLSALPAVRTTHPEVRVAAVWLDKAALLAGAPRSPLLTPAAALEGCRRCGTCVGVPGAAGAWGGTAVY